MKLVSNTKTVRILIGWPPLRVGGPMPSSLLSLRGIVLFLLLSLVAALAGCPKEKGLGSGSSQTSSDQVVAVAGELYSPPEDPLLDSPRRRIPLGDASTVAEQGGGASGGSRAFAPSAAWTPDIQFPEGSLTIPYAGPSGPVDLPNQVVVAFDRPMAPLASLDDPQMIPPVSLSPAIPGIWRWAGTSTATFTPQGFFPNATAFTVTVTPGATALDGTALKVPVSFSFETPRPLLEGMVPNEDDSTPLDPVVTLIWNQRVDPAALLGKVSWKSDSGAPVPFTLRRPAPQEGQGKDLLAALERRVELVPGRALVPNTRYVVEVAAGSPGMEGPLPLTEAFSGNFSTYPPLRVDSGIERGGTVSPATSLDFQFSTPITTRSFLSSLSITPSVTLPLLPEEDEDDASTWQAAWVYLTPRTTYTLTLSGKMKDKYGQSLGEDYVTTFTTTDRDPFMEMASTIQVIPSWSLQTMPLQYRNLRDLQLGALAMSPEEAIALLNAKGGQMWWEDSRLFAQTELSQSVAVPPPDNKVHVAQLDFLPLLQGKKTGLVWVEASTTTPSPWNDEPLRPMRALFQITDLSATLKMGPESSVVWVTDLSQGQPVGEAEVVWFYQGKEVRRARTGADGVVRGPGGAEITQGRTGQDADDVKVMVRKGEDATIAYGEWTGDYQPWAFGLPNQSWNAAFPRGYAFTDRGVYRAGDEVHWKAYLRTQRDGKMAGAVGAKVKWKAEDDEGNEVASGEGVLDRFSSLDGTFSLGKDARLGIYHVSVVAPVHAQGIEGVEATASSSFQVAAYRAPAFRVDVVTSRPGYRTGERFSGTVQARYLFGAPMAGAQVRYDLIHAPGSFSPEGYESWSLYEERPWWSGNEYAAPTPGGDVGSATGGSGGTLSSGTATVARDGSLTVDLPIAPGPDHGPRDFTLTAEVTDLDRQTVAGSVTARVHPGEFYVGLKPQSFLAEAGKPLGMDLVAVTPEARLVPGRKVDLQLSRRTWDSVRQKALDGTWTWQVTPKDTPTWKKSLTTGAAAVSFQVPVKEAGYYVLRARSRDASGNDLVSDATFYAVGAGEVAWGRSDDDRVELIADKRTYQVGDTARILIKAPFAPAQALLTVEREGVMEQRVLSLTGTAETVEIPLHGGHVPEVYASLVMVRGGKDRTGPEGQKPDFRIGYVKLPVDPRGSHLRVEVTPDRTEYQPRDEVGVRVVVKEPGGTPVDAQVALFAVDYGVLSLTGYQTPDPFSTFYASHGLGVVTMASAAEIFDRAAYLSKGDPGGGGGDEGGGADLRSDFRVVPLWVPGLETGADGVADARFALPDNLTTFRIMAVAVDGGTRFGAGDQEVRVSRKVMARPALPRFLRVGDQIQAGVVVHNNTEQDGEVTVTVQKSDGITLRGARSRVVKVPKGGAMEVAFSFHEPKEGEAVFQFSAVMGVNRDAVEAKLPVLDEVPLETVATFAEANPTARERIKPPPLSPHPGGELRVELGTSLLSGLDAAVNYVLEYPYGCIEQTLSRTLPVALLMDLGDRAGLSIPRDSMRKAVNAGIERLGLFSTGRGLSYWPGSRVADPYASSYALLAMATLDSLEKGGTDLDPVPPDLMEEAARYVHRFVNGQEPVPYWWSEDTLRAAKALGLLALARSGQGDAAQNANLFKEWAELPLFGQAELLAAIVETKGAGAPALTREGLRLLSARAVVDPTTAHFEEADQELYASLWSSNSRTTGIIALTLMGADPAHPLIPKVVRWLGQNRSTDGRWGNTQEVTYALLALREYAVRYEKDVPDLMATVKLGSEMLLQQPLKGRGPGKAVARAGLEKVRSMGEQDLVIEKKGVGRLYYTASLSYPSPDGAPPRDMGFTVGRTVQVLEGLGQGQTLEPGALVRVTLTVSTPFDRNFVVVKDSLPAGLEPVDRSFATTSARYGELDEEEEIPWWQEQDFNHSELKDDAVELFADWLSAGLHTYSYLARATTPGVYDSPPPYAEEMYSPGVFGRGQGGVVVVAPPQVSAR